MQVQVDHSDGVVNRKARAILGVVVAVAVFALDGLEVVELGEQTFAQIAGADADWDPSGAPDQWPRAGRRG